MVWSGNAARQHLGARLGPHRVCTGFCQALVLTLTLLGALLTPLQAQAATGFVGVKAYYLALGDSLAFGYQPNFDWSHGYTNQWYTDLRSHGSKNYTNYGCNGETSSTFINGGCPHAGLVHNAYSGSQLAAGVAFIKAHPGQVSPVSLDIGANDMLGDIDSSTCVVSSTWDQDLATLDANLVNTILPQLTAALTNTKGARTGDLVMMNYYDPYQNLCPGQLSYVTTLNQHIAADAAKFGVPVADVFTAFGGDTTPNPNPTICTGTWMCSSSRDIHATGGSFGEAGNGYGLITAAFKKVTGY